jgi:hypothetical protein
LFSFRLPLTQSPDAAQPVGADSWPFEHWSMSPAGFAAHAGDVTTAAANTTATMIPIRNALFPTVHTSVAARSTRRPGA